MNIKKLSALFSLSLILEFFSFLIFYIKLLQSDPQSGFSIESIHFFSSAAHKNTHTTNVKSLLSYKDEVILMRKGCERERERKLLPHTVHQKVSHSRLQTHLSSVHMI